MKCKVCGKRFKLKKENKYEVSEPVVGLFTMGESKITECFDCPKCGCQNVLNTRIGKKISKVPKPTQDELDQAFREGYEKGYECCKKDNGYEKSK